MGAEAHSHAQDVHSSQFTPKGVACGLGLGLGWAAACLVLHQAAPGRQGALPALSALQHPAPPPGLLSCQITDAWILYIPPRPGFPPPPRAALQALADKLVVDAVSAKATFDKALHDVEAEADVHRAIFQKAQHDALEMKVCARVRACLHTRLRARV